jgi:NADPH-dependent 2,4-dienoyl-CoA reductase/sulfur reductase-like enzyme
MTGANMAPSSACQIIWRSPPTGQPRQRLWKIVARRAILATGAIERPLVFGGNDRPA